MVGLEHPECLFPLKCFYDSKIFNVWYDTCSVHVAFVVFHALSLIFMAQKGGVYVGFLIDAHLGHTCGVSIHFDGNETKHLAAFKFAVALLFR